MNHETPLFSNPWVRVTIEASGRVVRVQRTAERMTVEALVSFVPQLAEHLPLARRGRLRLLLDSRLAPLLADDAMERQISTSTRQLTEGFERRAVLVNTAVGRLQARRFSREHLTGSPIFDNEAEALAFLLA